ncbi:MAG: tetratricopeptide repeat protein [Lentisphaerae bacterium]|nr:tetratricopeptide repeat protein [Lentisphaerota bacterium]
MVKSFTYSLLGLILLLSTSGCGVFSLRHSLREGEAALKDHNYEAAIRHLSRAAARIPNDAALQYNLATAHFYLGSFIPAETALEKVLELTPGDTQAVELQGQIALQRGQWERARTCFNNVLKELPTDAPRLLSAIANVERGAMNPDLARVRLLQALKADWKYAPAHYNLAMLYNDHFDLIDEAIDELELFRRMANSNDPQLPRAVKTIDTLTKLRNARARATPAANRDTAASTTKTKDADRAAVSRQWTRAETLYRAALTDNPENANAAFGLGKTLLASRRKSEALTAFTLTTELNPNHADAYYQGAFTALELGKLPEAATLLHRAAARWPERDSFFALLISLRSAEKNLAGARAYGEYYLEVAPPGEQRRKYENWLKSLPL